MECMFNSGIKKVPVILQMEALECGAASLAMICAYYKKFIPLSVYAWSVAFLEMAVMRKTY